MKNKQKKLLNFSINANVETNIWKKIAKKNQQKKLL